MFTKMKSEVTVVGKALTRDTLKQNEQVLAVAVRLLGLRVSVPTVQTHVAELYKFMEIDCPSNLPQRLWYGSCMIPYLINNLQFRFMHITLVPENPGIMVYRSAEVAPATCKAGSFGGASLTSIAPEMRRFVVSVSWLGWSGLIPSPDLLPLVRKI